MFALFLFTIYQLKSSVTNPDFPDVFTVALESKTKWRSFTYTDWWRVKEVTIARGKIRLYHFDNNWWWLILVHLYLVLYINSLSSRTFFTGSACCQRMEWGDVCDLLSTDCLHSEQVCIKHRSCTQQYNTIASTQTSDGNRIGTITNVCIFLVHTCIREYWFLLNDNLSKDTECFQ